MEENFMISATFSHPRTFHLEILSTRKTPARTFYTGGNFASIEHLQDPARLKSRKWNIAKSEMTQHKKRTWYRQRSHINVLFTYKYFPDVKHPRGHFWEAETVHLLRISKIPRLKTGLWYIAKLETMQWMKAKWYRQQFYIYARFT